MIPCKECKVSMRSWGGKEFLRNRKSAQDVSRGLETHRLRLSLILIANGSGSVWKRSMCLQVSGMMEYVKCIGLWV